jgi:hypothetical protein
MSFSRRAENLARIKDDRERQWLLIGVTQTLSQQYVSTSKKHVRCINGEQTECERKFSRTVASHMYNNTKMRVCWQREGILLTATHTLLYTCMRYIQSKVKVRAAHIQSSQVMIGNDEDNQTGSFFTASNFSYSKSFKKII